MRVATVLAVLLVAAGAALGGEPTAPKLGAEPPAPVPQEREPARRLPPTVAVCEDETARRCWLASREADCAAGGGHVFRLVIDQPDRADAEQALAQCREGAQSPQRAR
jgi:hypothetical protein